MCVIVKDTLKIGRTLFALGYLREIIMNAKSAKYNIELEGSVMGKKFFFKYHIKTTLRIVLKMIAYGLCVIGATWTTIERLITYFANLN